MLKSQPEPYVNALILQQSDNFNFEHIGLPINLVTEIHKSDLSAHIVDEVLGSSSTQAQQFAEILAEIKDHQVPAQPGSVAGDHAQAAGSIFFSWIYDHLQLHSHFIGHS